MVDPRPASGIGWRRPTALADATAALAHGATPLGGGAALASLAFPPRLGATVLDLAGLGLDALELPRVGAMVTFERLCASSQLAATWPVVHEAACVTATPEVRRLATVGGTVASRLPTSDLIAALCAAHARVTLADGMGRRELDLHVYLAEAPAAIVVDVLLGPGAPGAYRRIAARPGFAPALASVAGTVRGGSLELWAGAVATRPFRIDADEQIDEAALRRDGPVSAAYRRDLVTVLRDDVVAALQHHIGSAKGEAER